MLSDVVEVIIFHIILYHVANYFFKYFCYVGCEGNQSVIFSKPVIPFLVNGCDVSSFKKFLCDSLLSMFLQVICRGNAMES